MCGQEQLRPRFVRDEHAVSDKRPIAGAARAGNVPSSSQPTGNNTPPRTTMSQKQDSAPHARVSSTPHAAQRINTTYTPLASFVRT